MLKNLIIKNFILIEDIEINFTSGLNIITGESGSGKSAILKAVDALLGAKVDATCIFTDKDIAIIEATFELKDKTELQKILAGYELEQSITLRREISKNNKSRFFIDDQLISLSQIKDLAIFLADYISQKQASSLSQEKYIRSYIDSLADCKEEVNLLGKKWSLSKTIYDEIDLLSNQKNILNATISTLKDELVLIEKINYQPNEEKQVEQQHAKLINSCDIKKLINEANYMLSGSPDSILSKLRQVDKIFQKLENFNYKTSDFHKSFKTAYVELEELDFELSKESSKIETDSNLINNLENRLKEIDLLSKKLNLDLSDIESKKQKLLKDLDSFEKIDNDLIDLKNNQKDLNIKIEQLCASITLKRSNIKAVLKEKMHKELAFLNLKNCSFDVVLEEKKRSATGDENVHFHFSANLNVKSQPLQKIASGGELSRVMLALKCIIADKDLYNCLIFDEIDSNVGGKSASIIGDKLLKLSSSKQIICVTHFVQVAKKATSHFLVEKKQKNLKNFIFVTNLNNSQKNSEYQRMVGLEPVLS